MLGHLGYVSGRQRPFFAGDVVASTQPLSCCISALLDGPPHPSGLGHDDPTGGDLRADDGGNVGVVV
jgi:hypothetical protein